MRPPRKIWQRRVQVILLSVHSFTQRELGLMGDTPKKLSPHDFKLGEKWCSTPANLTNFEFDYCQSAYIYALLTLGTDLKNMTTIALHLHIKLTVSRHLGRWDSR